MTNLTTFVELTHQELLLLTPEEKQKYKDSRVLDVYGRIKIAVEHGVKHIQFGWSGCIKVKRNENGIYYTTRNGKGSGQDLVQSSDLLDCVKAAMSCGWYDSDITYK